MSARRGPLIVTLVLPTALVAAGTDLETRLGDALHARVKLPVGEVLAPRPTAELPGLLTPLVEAHPDRVEPIAALARSLVALGRLPEAEAAWEAYVAKAPVRAEALGQLADWLVERRELPKALARLEERAGLTEGLVRAETYTRMLELVATYRPAGVDPLALHAQRVAAAPDVPGHRLEYVEATRQAKGPEAALALLDETLAGRTGDRVPFEAARAELLFALGRADQARQDAEGAALRADDEAAWDRYFGMLRRHGLYETRRDALESAFKDGLIDEAGARTLFQMIRANLYGARSAPEDGVRVLEYLETMAGGDAVALVRVAHGYSQIGRKERALSRLLRAHRAATAAKAAGLTRRTLLELVRFSEAETGPGVRVQPAREAASLAARLDRSPGILAGVASFYFNGQASPGESFQGLARNAGGLAALARLDGWIAAEVKARPDAPEAPLLLAAWARRLVAQGERSRGADLWLKAAELATDPKARIGYRIDAAEAVLQAGQATPEADRPRAEKILAAAVDEARRLEARELRLRAFGLLEESMKVRGARGEVLGLYQKELDASPKDPDAYERFLSVLARYQLHAETAAVYKRAIASLGGQDWFARAGRWYLGRKMVAELDGLSREAVDRLGSSGLAEYLGEFARYQHKSAQHRDSALYLELYRAASKRFPHDLRFVRGLLRYHEQFGDKASALALRLAYGLREPDLLRPWLQDAMKGGNVLRHLAALASDATPAGLALRARLLEWLSRFEEAAPLWDALVDVLPGEPWAAEGAARLARALADPAKAAGAYARLARLSPGVADWRIKQGEAEIEGGDTEAARSTWKGLPALAAGRPESWREAATVLWDYYMFDDAAELLAKGREVLRDPEVFARELAFVHESRRDWQGAATEYTRLLVADSHDWVARGRLGKLVADGRGDLVMAVFATRLAAEPDRVALYKAWSRFAEIRGGGPGLEVEPLRRVLAKASAMPALEWLRARAVALADPVFEEEALLRIAEVSGRAPERLFALAGFYEAAGRTGLLDTVVSELETAAQDHAVARPRLARRVHLFLAELAWRRGDKARALEQWKHAYDRAEGAARREDGARLAERWLEQGRRDEARELLAAMQAEEPLEVAWTERLARIPVLAGDKAGVETLYRAAIQRIRSDATAPRTLREQLVPRLRQALIRDLSQVGGYEEALEELMVLVEQSPTADVVDAAVRFARQHRMLDRMQGRLKRWAKDSPKDFRPHRVLAWVAAAEERLDEAAAALQAALAVEPQRTDVRLERAVLLTRSGRHAEARDEYLVLRGRRGDGGGAWIPEIAATYRMEGKADEARAWLEKLRRGSLRTAEDYDAELAYVRGLEAAGQDTAALEALQPLFDGVGPVFHPYDETCRLLATLLRRVEGAGKAFTRLMQLARILKATPAAADSEDRARGSTGGRLQGIATGFLADEVRSRGRAAERRALRAALVAEGALAGLEYGEGIALFERAGFEDLVLSARLGRRPGGLPPPPDWEAGSILDYLRDFGHDAELVRALEAARERASNPEQAARMAERLARHWRAAADPARELAALESASPQGREPWHLGDADRRRYLDLLRTARGPAAFEADLATRGIWGVNEALRRDDPALALRLLDRLGDPQGATGLLWKRDAATRIGMRFSHDPARMAGEFEGLLDLRTMAEQLARHADPESAAVGAAFFPLAERYARFLLREGRKDEADRFAAALVEGRPRDPRARLETAGLLDLLGRRDEALAMARRALDLGPADRSIQEAVAERLVGLGQRAEGLALLAPWVEKAPPESGVWVRYLAVLTRLGAPEVAREAWLAALEARGDKLPLERAREVLEGLFPEGVREPWVEAAGARLAKAWAHSGPHSELLARVRSLSPAARLAAFRVAVAGTAGAPVPAQLEYRRRLFRALEAVGEQAGLAAVVAEMEQLWAKLPSTDPAELGRRGLERAELLGRAQGPAAAVAALKGLLPAEGDPGEVAGLWSGAMGMLDRLGAPTEAAALELTYYQRRYAAAGRDQPGVMRGLGRALLAAGRGDEGARILGSLGRRDPTDARTMRAVAGELEAGGRRTEALEFYGRLAALDPHDAGARVGRARCLLADPATLETGLGELAAVLASPDAGEADRDAVFAALVEAKPAAASMQKAFLGRFADGDASAEAKEGLAAAALGRGEAGAEALLAAAAAAEPVQSRALAELARRRVEAGDEGADSIYWELVRRGFRRWYQGTRPGPATRALALRLAGRGKAFAAAALLDEDRTLEGRVESVAGLTGRSPTPLDRALGVLGDAPDGAGEPEYDPGEGESGDGEGEGEGGEGGEHGEQGPEPEEAAVPAPAPTAGVAPWEDLESRVRPAAWTASDPKVLLSDLLAAWPVPAAAQLDRFAAALGETGEWERAIRYAEAALVLEETPARRAARDGLAARRSTLDKKEEERLVLSIDG